MAEQTQQEPNIVPGCAIDVLAAAYASGRKVRFWLDSSGNITGIWQGRNGKTCAVFTFGVKRLGATTDRSKVYFGMSFPSMWDNPCGAATREAMLAYQAAQIAARND